MIIQGVKHDIQCYEVHSCLIQERRRRQLKAEKGRKSQLKDESRKQVPLEKLYAEETLESVVALIILP